MKNSLIILVFVIFVLPSYAQSNLISLQTEYNSEGDAIIYSNSQASVNYTLKINFSNLIGYLSSVSNPFITSVNAGRNQLTKLVRDKNAGSRIINYSYNYYAGSAFRKTPVSYIHYILPITPGKTTKVTKVESLSDLLGQKSDNQLYAQGFNYNLGDTICATRAGIVYNINDQLKQGEGRDTIFTDSRNKIHIQHKDGTLGYYSILSPIKSLVQNGDFVIPGQPIAIFNKSANKYTMLFSVYYLDEEKIRADVPKDVYNALPISYYLNENALSTKLVENQKYDSKLAPVIISEELNKREKKKYGFLN
jgi:uncharacterized protein (UPF0297 family)